MIVGSGLLARAFAARFSDDRAVWIYAAGVSNSGCRDPQEFERERARLRTALDDCVPAEAFVYFSTCSVYDPASLDSDYVQHKLRRDAL